VNMFADLSRLITSRPGDAMEPPRATRAPMPPRHMLPAVETPWDLSPMEYEVMRLTLELLSCREIGEALGRSPKTIEVHRENAKRKMAAKNLMHAVLLMDRHSRGVA
jgi:DNA-binding CsgD family transcriptional regulator